MLSRLLKPQELRQEFPLHGDERLFIRSSRNVIREILQGVDSRLLLVMGPCSIHDLAAAQEYAEKLKCLQEKVSDVIYIVMRTYMEKARTAVGWKGMIYDPDLDGSHDMQKGLCLSRQFLLWLANQQIPAATEFLDPLVYPYYGDLISWGCIGARTSTSQIHRQFASGLPMPIAFKNSVDGNVDVAINGVLVARASHVELGIDEAGEMVRKQTEGNPDTHIVLRGGEERPNYDALSVERVTEKLQEAGLPLRVMIDCSHDNSGKCHERQAEVFKAVIQDYLQNHNQIFGLLVESHLKAGKISPAINEYGRSITDSCIDWGTTERLVLWAAEQLRKSVVKQEEIAQLKA